MGVVDLNLVSKYVDIGPEAGKLLSKNDQEHYANLNLKWGGKLIQADSYIVFHSMVRGPAKGGIRLAEREQISHRLAAWVLAVDEVVQSMRDRGWI